MSGVRQFRNADSSEEQFDGCSFFIVKSESKRSPGTDFAAEDRKENILLYNCKFSNVKSDSNKTFEYESNVRPLLIGLCIQITTPSSHIHRNLPSSDIIHGVYIQSFASRPARDT